MPLNVHFSRNQLNKITSEGLIYMCACPAELAATLCRLRDFYDYQGQCASGGGNEAVHARIAQGIAQAHAELEQCLLDVLNMEGWDSQTLEMPAGLRRLQEELLEQPA